MHPPTFWWLAMARPQGFRRLPCYIVASPDPRISPGFEPLDKQYNYYALMFGWGCHGPGTAYFNSKNPIYIHAYNFGSQYTGTHLPFRTGRSKSAQSDWLYLIDRGLKSFDGKRARRVLIDIIEAFPKYDLQSDEGINKAIEEMATKLGKVVSFEERGGR